MTKFRSFLVGLLLVPVFALNASPAGTEADGLSLDPARPVAGYCWFYWQGRWIQMPC
jgi:hypothetical protein